MRFLQKLDGIIDTSNSLVCVGLDSDVRKLPLHLRGNSRGQWLFNQQIIQATYDFVCGYKLNSAFYEGQGAAGIEVLKKTCDFIRGNYPELVIILDAKRGDIGSTNEGYLQFAFDYLCVDAITLHPYLGKEALQPFLQQKDKGCIILCRTSNPGSGEFQDLVCKTTPLYQIVAHNVANDWNINDNCLLVVGATYPEEMKNVRKIAPDMTFLVPGIGAQGGDIEKTVRAGKTRDGKGMIIHAARSIIFASSGKDFAQIAQEETIHLKETINVYRQ